MLDRSKVIKEISSLSHKLFLDGSIDFQAAKDFWLQMIHDEPFLERVRAGIDSPYLLPTWSENIDTAIEVHPASMYTVIAVDGSQIYPDRHQGIACYLINIGSIHLHYGLSRSSHSENGGKGMAFSSEPFVCINEESTSQDVVNCVREEYELRAAVDLGRSAIPRYTATAALGMSGNSSFATAIMLDGSLIFWHLESKEPAIKEKFLKSYIDILNEGYEQRISLASYISWPKSKELVNIMRMYQESEQLEKLLDSHVANFFLPPSHRTIIFQHRSPIAIAYPVHLKPHFFYLNVGEEIARVEIPAWIADDEEMVQMIAGIILDQALKGRGYPVCLAEAHEQAVVKGPDRDFFYHVLQKVGIEHKYRYGMSQKSLRKRGIGI